MFCVFLLLGPACQAYGWNNRRNKQKNEWLHQKILGELHWCSVWDAQNCSCAHQLDFSNFHCLSTVKLTRSAWNNVMPKKNRIHRELSEHCPSIDLWARCECTANGKIKETKMEKRLIQASWGKKGGKPSKRLPVHGKRNTQKCLLENFDVQCDGFN